MPSCSSRSSIVFGGRPSTGSTSTDLPLNGPLVKSACRVSGVVGGQVRVFGEQFERPRVKSAIAVVVNPPKPSIARRDFLVCGMEANRCEQAARSVGRSVIAVA